ncbi:unnamed protein product, partial [marine sediment metagenome]
MEVTSKTSLFRLLLSFAKKVRARLSVLDSKGWFETIELLYTKPTVTDFKYKEGSVSYSLSYNNFVKKKRFIKNQKDFIDKEIKSISEYSEIVATMIKRKAYSENKAQHILNKLVQYLEKEEFTKISDATLSEIIHTFICDVDNGPVYWENTIFINGIWPKEESYQVTDEIQIRQPQKSDYEKVHPAGVPHIGFPTFPSSFSAVIKFILFHKSSQDNQKAINGLI